MNLLQHDIRHDINMMIRKLCFFFSFSLLIASPLAAWYTGEWGTTLSGWVTILTHPCPLVTDYFRLGNLSSAFFNAGVCGLSCALLTCLPGAVFRPNVWAGYFLVIAHCFYGLNFVNMWPPMLGFLVYCRVTRKRFRDNLEKAMFITAFGPFVSELLFRYPVSFQWPVILPGGFQVNIAAVFLVVLLSLFLGFSVPAMLPGAQLLHRGYNLYNGGLATGLLGLFIFSFMYKTFGIESVGPEQISNAVYEAHGSSYLVFCNLFYLFVFGTCLVNGFWKNGRSFRGYSELLNDSGYQTNFIRQYGIPCSWINLGIYGLMMVAYFDVVILLTDGAGYTGATCGIILAAMTFAASGQHPKNVWPILAGYAGLSLLVTVVCTAVGREIPWTLSTQGYMNGIAFATGLCPFTGKYGKRVGFLAGFLSAVMCTTTSVMHGGFVLYNGGLTAGIAALILLPLLDLYYHTAEITGIRTKYGEKEQK